MTLRRYELAASSFSRVVSIEPEVCFLLAYTTRDALALVYNFYEISHCLHQNGEAWNNLATIHLQTQSYALALHALEQSARFLQDSWKVWDNYLTAAMVHIRYHENVGLWWV